MLFVNDLVQYSFYVKYVICLQASSFFNCNKNDDFLKKESKSPPPPGLVIGVQVAGGEAHVQQKGM